MYKKTVRPILTYGVKSGPETMTTRRHTQVAEMKSLRRMLGRTGRDKVTINIPCERHSGLDTGKAKTLECHLGRIDKTDYVRETNNRPKTNEI